jgi:Tol biopolymer transport system component
MLKRCLSIGLVALVLAVMASSVAAVAPPGPRLAVLKSSPDSQRSEIATLGPGGGDPRTLAKAPAGRGRFDVYGIPAWSPDGSQVAFSHATTGKGPRRISLVPADGGPARIVPGTEGGVLPLFTPDGRELAFARIRNRRLPGEPRFVRYESTAVWIVDLATGMQRQLTRWRDNLEQYPASFSPDGSTLLVTRVDQERGSEPEAVAVRFDGRTSSLIIAAGAFPVYSPDGTQIALFRNHGEGVDSSSDLYVIDADGSHLRRLTHTPNAQELFASWDPSGQRIAYSRVPRDSGGLYEGAAVMEINADGSCATRVKAAKGSAFLGPAWQPGPGREAGALIC